MLEFEHLFTQNTLFLVTVGHTVTKKLLLTYTCGCILKYEGLKFRYCG